MDLTSNFEYSEKFRYYTVKNITIIEVPFGVPQINTVAKSFGGIFLKVPLSYLCNQGTSTGL